MLVLPSVQILDLKLLEGSLGGKREKEKAAPELPDILPILTHSEGDALGECVWMGGGVCTCLTGR